MRIAYAAGPGDVAGTFACWQEGRDDPSQVSVTYSSQVFDMCRQLGAEALVIASHPRKCKVHAEGITVIHRATPFAQRGGLLYHLGQLWSAMRFVVGVLVFRADVAVISDASHWYVFSLLNWVGVRVVPSVHCVLWPTHKRVPRVLAALNKLNRVFFRGLARRGGRVLTASDVIAQQVKTLGGPALRSVEFLPTYRQGSLDNRADVEWEARPFRLLYAGRIEPEKGVFDLLEAVAKLRELLRERGPDTHGIDLQVDICGEGSALGRLKNEIADRKLGDTINCHGHCARDEMARYFREAHAVVVPTRSDFVEGFNQVVAEAVLAGRPVIATPVCPAVAYFPSAVAVIRADDPTDCSRKIERLMSDRSHYLALQRGCESGREQLTDLKTGFAAGLMGVIQSGSATQSPSPMVATPEATS